MVVPALDGLEQNVAGVEGGPGSAKTMRACRRDPVILRAVSAWEAAN